MARLLLPLLMLLVGIIRPSLATYQLAQDYTGINFYRGFEFFTDPDPTQGHVRFQSMIDANGTGLAGFLPNANSTNLTDAVYMAVDSDQIAPDGRGAVRVTSTQSFMHALVIADIGHMPGGICGTWPAFWMVGTNWPENGEIDIIEGVNDQTANIMTLHTAPGPILNSNTAHFAGRVATSNCDVNAPDQSQNAGCSIDDDSDLTYGTGFNNAGGGVFAMEWTSLSIKIWFFARGQIPEDIQSGTPSPGSNWGTPRSLFQGAFNMDDHIKQQQIVFDTTFCGAWAGQVWNSTPGCAALAPTCEDYVTNNPAAFVDAYWAVNSLMVFQDDGQASSQQPVANGTAPDAPPPGVVPYNDTIGGPVKRDIENTNEGARPIGIQRRARKSRNVGRYVQPIPPGV